jgi:hypothetical protein
VITFTATPLTLGNHRIASGAHPYYARNLGTDDPRLRPTLCGRATTSWLMVPAERRLMHLSVVDTTSDM